MEAVDTHSALGRSLATATYRCRLSEQLRSPEAAAVLPGSTFVLAHADHKRCPDSALSPFESRVSEGVHLVAVAVVADIADVAVAAVVVVVVVQDMASCRDLA